MAASLDDLHKRLLAASPTPEKSDMGALWERLKTASEKPAEPQTSAGEGLWEGLKHGFAETAQQMEKFSLPTVLPGAEAGRQRMLSGLGTQEQAAAGSPAAQQHPNWALGGRVLGGAAAAAPLAAMPSGAALGLGGRALMGAGQGAITGGVPGAVTGGLTGGLGGMIGPALDPAFQAIAQQFPTLARMATGSLGRTEEAFQRATANEVLRDIGETVPANIKVGEPLINHAHDVVDDVYNKITPQVTFRGAEIDPYSGTSFSSGLPAIAQNVPKSHQDDFAEIANKITSKLDAGGNMSGRAWKDADGEINREVKYYQRHNALGDDRKYVAALRELQGSMRDTLALHNPQQADALRRADASWHKLVLMEEAAGRRIDSNSQFLPNDLLMVSRKETGNRRFARGQGVLTAYGRAGNDLLSSKPPAFKRYIADIVGAAIGAGLGGVAGHAVGGPVGAGIAATLGGGAGVAATKAMRGTVSAARQTPTARAIGATVGRAAPIAGAEGEEAYVSTIGP